MDGQQVRVVGAVRGCDGTRPISYSSMLRQRFVKLRGNSALNVKVPVMWRWKAADYEGRHEVAHWYVSLSIIAPSTRSWDRLWSY